MSKGIHIDILRRDGDWRGALPRYRAHIRAALVRTLSTEKITAAELSVLLSDDAGLRALNGAYRGKDKPTNVLSFPQTSRRSLKSGLPVHLGDIALSLETLTREAAEQNKPLPDHVRHMVVHGCLHLLHYDHQTKAEAKAMENKEIEILKTLGIKNPYLLD